MGNIGSISFANTRQNQRLASQYSTNVPTFFRTLKAAGKLSVAEINYLRRYSPHNDKGFMSEKSPHLMQVLNKIRTAAAPNDISVISPEETARNIQEMAIPLLFFRAPELDSDAEQAAKALSNDDLIFLARYEPPADQGFMWDSNPRVSDIGNKIEKAVPNHHSAASMAFAIRAIQANAIPLLFSRAPELDSDAEQAAKALSNDDLIFLATYQPPADQGFMWDSNPRVSDIGNKIEKAVPNHHSGASMAFAIRAIQANAIPLLFSRARELESHDEQAANALSNDDLIFLATYKPPADQGFMWDSNPRVSDIENKIEKAVPDHHSGASMAFAIRAIQANAIPLLIARFHHRQASDDNHHLDIG